MPQNSYMLPQDPTAAGGLQAGGPQLGGVSAVPGMQFSPMSPGFGGGSYLRNFLNGGQAGGGQLGPNQFRGAHGGVQGLGAHAQQLLAQGRQLGQFGQGGMPQPAPSPWSQGGLQGAMPPPLQAGAPQLEQLEQLGQLDQLRNSMQGAQGQQLQGASQGPQTAPQPAQGLQAQPMPIHQPQQGQPMPGKPLVPPAAGGARPAVSSGAPGVGGGGQGMQGMQPGARAGQVAAVDPVQAARSAAALRRAQAGVAQDSGYDAQVRSMQPARRPFANPQFQQAAVARGAAIPARAQGIR